MLTAADTTSTIGANGGNVVADGVVNVRPGKTIMDCLVADALVKWASGNSSKDVKEGLVRDLDEYVAALSGPAPTPAESILAETAALSWFALRMHEVHFAGSSSSGNGMTINQAKFHLTKIDRAHARLMSTLKTLATVRRLAIPAVQINIAKQQVNQQIVSGSHDRPGDPSNPPCGVVPE